MSRTNFEIMKVEHSLAREAPVFPPSLKQVYDLWLQLAGDNFAPSWRDLRLNSLPPEMIPWAVVLDVIDGGDDFRYRFYSAERASLRNKDYTGSLLSEYEPPEFRKKVYGEYHKVLDAREPVLFTTTVSVPNIETWRENEHKTYALLRMPLTGDGETIDRMMSIDAIEYVYEWQMRFRHWPSFNR